MRPSQTQQSCFKLSNRPPIGIPSFGLAGFIFLLSGCSDLPHDGSDIGTYKMPLVAADDAQILPPGEHFIHRRCVNPFIYDPVQALADAKAACEAFYNNPTHLNMPAWDAVVCDSSAAIALPLAEPCSLSGSGAGTSNLAQNLVDVDPGSGTTRIKIKDKESPALSPNGHLKYSIADCVSFPCPMEIAEMVVSVPDFEVDGHPVEDVLVQTIRVVYTTVDANGNFTLPSGSMRMATKFRIDDEGGSVTVANDGHLLVGQVNPDTDTFSLNGTLTEDDVVVTLRLGGHHINRRPTAQMVLPAGDVECDAVQSATVAVGSSSTDPDGNGNISVYLWRTIESSGAFGPYFGETASASNSFPLGTTEIQLYVGDYHLAGHVARDSVTVVDTTPPAFSLTPQEPLSGCGIGTVPLLPPTISDICWERADLTLTAQLVAHNGQTVTPIDLGPGYELPAQVGASTVRWTATDASGNSAFIDQQILVASGIMSNGKFDIADRASVVNSNGDWMAITNIGQAQVSVGVQGSAAAGVGSVYSAGRVFLRNFSTVHGDAYAYQDVELQAGASVEGDTYEYTSWALPQTPSYYSTAGGSGNVNVNSNDTITLQAGSHGSVNINSGGHLILAAGNHGFTTLNFNSAATLTLQGSAPHVTITNQWTNNGTLVSTSVPTIVYLGQNQATLDTSLEANIIAPNGRVAIQSDFTGRLFAKEIEVRPDVVVTCGSAD